MALSDPDEKRDAMLQWMRAHIHLARRAKELARHLLYLAGELEELKFQLKDVQHIVAVSPAEVRRDPHENN